MDEWLKNSIKANMHFHLSVAVEQKPYRIYRIIMCVYVCILDQNEEELVTIC